MRDDGGGWTRRDALRAAAGGLVTLVSAPLLGACGPGPTEARAAPWPPRPPRGGTAPQPLATAHPAPGGAIGEGCLATHDDIEGPYYLPGAPERADLAGGGVRGTPLIVRGRVTGLDCARGLAGVELDVWQADADGRYDNDGSRRPAPAPSVRGRLRTDDAGAYAFRTIVPGRYLNGARYRPAHIHVKLRAAGFHPLTTQLYFPGDPYNEGDPFIHRSLIMSVEEAEGSRVARFDFALPPG